MMAAPLADAASRGLRVELRQSEAAGAPAAGSVQLYSNSYALVIGIDAYKAGWPRLSNAVKDAKAVARALSAKGFEVTLKTNLDAAPLEIVLREFFVLKGQDKDARLFVWYAGHGYTEGGEGYLVPADAPRPSARARFKLKALPLRRFGEYVRLADSKHAFAVFDSCFAGTVFDNQRALPPAAVTRATTLPVRQFLTSGDAGQTVSDDGTFRELFIRALNGDERADANGDRYVTASELGLFLSTRVTNLTRSRQTPRYGKLRDKDYDRGDFVFKLPAREKPKPKHAPKLVQPPAKPDPTVELTFWNSVKDTDNPAVLDAYLVQYPSGTFAGLARVKIAELKDRLERRGQDAARAEAARKQQAEEAAKRRAQETKIARLRTEQETARARERELWQAVADSSDPGVVQAFLKRYPKSDYADLATARLATLNAKAAEAARHPQPVAPKRQVALVTPKAPLRDGRALNGKWFGATGSCDLGAHTTAFTMEFELVDGRAEGYVHKQGFYLQASPFKAKLKGGAEASFQLRSFGRNFAVTFGPRSNEAVVQMDDCKFELARKGGAPARARASAPEPKVAVLSPPKTAGNFSFDNIKGTWRGGPILCQVSNSSRLLGRLTLYFQIEERGRLSGSFLRISGGGNAYEEYFNTTYGESGDVSIYITEFDRQIRGNLTPINGEMHFRIDACDVKLKRTE